MKRIALVLLAIVELYSFQATRADSQTAAKPSIDVKWDRPGNIEKLVDDGHKETWTVTLTNNGNAVVDVWFK